MKSGLFGYQKERSFWDKIDKFPNGGVHVLAAPPGLGRQHIFERLRKKRNEFDDHAVYYGSELRKIDQLYTRFGNIDRQNDLFYYIPNGSAVIA